MQKPNLCNHESCKQSLIYGLANGIKFGFKIRFLHSLAYSFIFHKDESFVLRLKESFEKALEHGLILGLLCMISKSIVCFLNRMRNKKSKYHHFIAGLITGFLIFGKKTHVRQQVVLYLFSRILKAYPNYVQKKLPQVKMWKYVAALTWGITLYLFEVNYKNMTFSIAKDLKYIIKDSDRVDFQSVSLMPKEVPTIISKILIV